MRRVVGAAAILLALVIAFFGITTLQQEGLLDFTGLASNGSIFLCINEPPNVNISDCPTTVNQSTSIDDNTIYCNITATDGDNESLVFNAMSALPSWFWIDNETGRLTLRPFQPHVGTQMVTIYATDSSGCANGAGTSVLNLTVLDINDPPELIANVSNAQFNSGSSIAPYSLFDFFDDPDNDPLNFSVLGNSLVSVSITQSNGLVYYSSTSCGTDYLLFRATDTGNLSEDSGVVQVTSVCASTPSDTTGTSGSGSGFSSRCVSEWECRKWSACYINGTRSKQCIDLNGCTNNFLRTFWEECEYIPTCYDGVQNQNETGVDCGGPCRPCGTCFDGIQNNDEEDVDCGGSYCEPCMNCTDGIMNWGEIGIDCGGPCDPCPSCFDGIQNQGETGVDCGGPCPSCSIRETPGVMAQQSPLTLFIMLLAVLLVGIIIVFKFYHKQLMQALARLGLYLTQHKDKQVLLTEQEKLLLLGLLKSAKATMKQMERPASSLIDLLTDISRTYFRFALDLGEAFTRADVQLKADKALKHASFRRALESFFSLVESCERAATDPTYADADLMLEELRLLVLLSSKLVAEDLSHEATEKEVTGSSLERARSLLYNISLALQFEEPFAAKQHYLQLVQVYERLSEQQKGMVYTPMIRAYHEIKYVLSWF